MMRAIPSTSPITSSSGARGDAAATTDAGLDVDLGMLCDGSTRPPFLRITDAGDDLLLLRLLDRSLPATENREKGDQQDENPDDDE